MLGQPPGFPGTSLPFPRGDDLTFSIRRSSLLLPSPPCGWLGSITQRSPRKAGEHLFWEEFRQTNQPLRGTNRSMKMASSAKRADDISHLLSAYCMPDLGCRVCVLAPSDSHRGGICVPEMQTRTLRPSLYLAELGLGPGTIPPCLFWEQRIPELGER